MSVICYYHRGCQDGIGAAWAVYKKFPDAEFFGVIHDGSIPPGKVENNEIFIVDFSFDRKTLLQMREVAKTITLLDHHKSAIEKLNDLDFCHFDLNRSGAGLAWDHLFPEAPRPLIISYIEDQDLWRFALPNSKEINAAISSYPKTFEALDMISQKTQNELFEEGRHILRYQQQLVSEIAIKAQEIDLGDFKSIPIVNAPILQSQVGHRLCEGKPFSVSWFEDSKGDKVYSLRSSDQSEVDVSKVAAEMFEGGGGHFHAAGGRIKKGKL